MKIVKNTSIVLLSIFFLFALIPHAEAKHCNKYRYYKNKSRSTSFALNFNVDPQPRYVEYNYVAPPPVYQSVAVVPYQPTYIAQPVYYPAYQQQVIVQRPYAPPPVYVQPGFSYSYWKY